MNNNINNNMNMKVGNCWQDLNYAQERVQENIHGDPVSHTVITAQQTLGL
jgi:hypothetical protein